MGKFFYAKNYPSIRITCRSTEFMYQSIPSLTIPPATPGDSHVLTAREVGFSPNFLCPGGRGFESEKLSAVSQFRKKNAGISRFVSKKKEAA